MAGGSEIPPEKGFPLGLDPMLLSKALSNMLNRLRLAEQSPAKHISPLIKTKVVNVEEKIEEVIEKLSGIRCGFKSTSCPDQLAKALKKAISE